MVCRTAWAVVLAASTAWAAERPVFQIGQADGDYRELAIAGQYAAFPRQFAKPVVFEAGKSQAANDWPYIHPGPADVWAGDRVHWFAIRFVLKDQPRGVFRLRIDLVSTHSGAPPTLAVRVGQREGRFRMPAGTSDMALTNPKAGKPQHVELFLPPEIFQQGANEIQLACLEGSWVLYDAVGLWNDPERPMPEPQIRELSVRPTPFYLRDGQQIRQVIDVALSTTVPVSDATVVVEAAGQRSQTTVQQLPQLGTLMQEITVPDAPRPLEVKVTATVGRHTRSVTARIEPQRKWRIFVAPSAHTDIGYTDIQPTCAERHNENLDLALDLCRKFPQFAWNLEVAWQAENYLKSRGPARVEEFLARAKEGRIGVQALYGNILTGLCSHEEACRLLAFAHGLHQKHGLPYGSAMISDVPTQEASLPMLLSGSGIRYFSSGINNTRAPRFTQLYEKCPAWWEGPDGSRVLMMWVRGYAHAAHWRLDQSVEWARVSVLHALLGYEARKDYPFDAVFLHGAAGDNRPLNPKLAEVVQAWNQRYAFPQIILCRNAEFFEYIEKHFGEKLPVLRGSGGTYWEDGAGSSARETALCRRAHEMLAAADLLFALLGRLPPEVGYPRAEFQAAWRNCLLYDEHTWGAHCSVTQPESEFTRAQWKIKSQFAVDAERQGRALLQRALRALAGRIRTEGPALVVVNPSSWARTDVVACELPAGTALDEPDCPVIETVENGRPAVRVLVRDVPAWGYRTLKLRAGARLPRAAAQPAGQATVVESRYYRAEFDPATGGIASLVDKQTGRELVDARAPYQLNQYLYVSGGRGPRNFESMPDAKLLKISTPQQATLHKTDLGSLGQMMRVETSARMTPRLQSTVILWNDVKRVDIVNRLTKTQTYEPEAVYFAFPFAAEKPAFRYEIPAGVVNPNTDMLPGACLDWFTVQHFVEVASPQGAIAWATPDAPLVTFQDINRGTWQTSLPMRTGHLYAYVMNNYWFTNYLAGQGGDFEFRFALTSRDKADAAASARFGWAVSNPLLAAVAGPNAGGTLPAGSVSLLAIDQPNVLVVGGKQAEDGRALVVRLWEAAGQPATTRLRLGIKPPRSAAACNLVEVVEKPLEIGPDGIMVPIRARGLATVRIED